MNKTNTSGFGGSAGGGFADFADFDNKVRNEQNIWHVGTNTQWKWQWWIDLFVIFI